MDRADFQAMLAGPLWRRHFTSQRKVTMTRHTIFHTTSYCEEWPRDTILEHSRNFDVLKMIVTLVEEFQTPKKLP